MKKLKLTSKFIGAIFFSVTCSLVSVAHAEKNTHKSSVVNITTYKNTVNTLAPIENFQTLPLPEFNFNLLTNSQINDKRSISNDSPKICSMDSNSPSISTPSMDKSLDQLKIDFHNAKTPEALDSFLEKLDKDYDSFSIPKKYVAAHMIAYREFRGILYRLIPFLNGNKPLHSMIVSNLRTSANQVAVYYPNEWEVAMKYLASPYKIKNNSTGKVSIVPTIDDEATFHGYITGNIRNSMRTLIGRLQAINLCGNEFIFDNGLLYSKANHVDPTDRYRIIGEVERHTTLASLYSFVSQLSFLRGYSMIGFRNFIKNTGGLYGFDGLVPFSKLEGAPYKDRANLSREQKQLAVALDPEGITKISMRASYSELAMFSLYSTYAWRETKLRFKKAGFENGNLYGVNYSLLMANEKLNDKRAKTMVSLLNNWDFSIGNEGAVAKDGVMISSAATGESIKVNLQNFYMNPPNDLKNLIPDQFKDETSGYKNLNVFEGNDKILFRDYNYGGPKGWSNLSEIKKFLPNANKSEDVFIAARVLDEAYGAYNLASPLAFLVR